MSCIARVATNRIEARAPAGNGVCPQRWLAHLAAAIVAAAALLWLETTDVDRSITSWFFDPVANRFPLRHDEFLEVVLHHWAKYAVVLLGMLALGGFVLAFLIEPLRPQRRVLLFVALSLTLAPASVTTLKTVSNKHCPWDLADYGGLVPYTRLFDTTPSGIKSGHCFPAGHASTGFALMAFYFVGRARGSRRAARNGLAAGLLAGSALGLGRIAQGAHFLSHTLWSGLVCWLVILALSPILNYSNE